MTQYRVALRPEAEEEIAEAATWYEAQQPGLAAEFLNAIFGADELLSNNPRLVSGRRRRRDVR